MASCWRDGEEERMAIGSFLKADLLQEQVENQVEIVGERKAEDISRDIIKGAAEVVIEELVKNPTKNSREEIKEETATDMTKVAIKDVVEDILESKTFAEEADSVSGTSMKAAAILEPEIKCDPEFRTAPCYRKINLSEIYTLPSSYWHFSNNSFLLHGFWNYGYLVVKEDVAQNEKKMLLGVPGIFEQPEMVMASYFGFPKFEALPSEMEAMEIGETYSCEKKNQQPQTGIFGCWFTNL
jgi:hypothetical protein